MSLTITKETPKHPSDTVDTDPLSANLVIRQDPFAITLDAPALLAVAILLVLGMHTISHLTLDALILLIPLALLIQNDVPKLPQTRPRRHPPTPGGYARLTWYRLFTLRDPFLPPPCDPSLLPTSGLLPATPLPYRPGPRPSVAGLAPQRQLTQPGSAAAYASLRASLAALAAREPSRFGTATSSVEKHGFALFARHPLNVCGNGEVVHIHTSDRSMHMNLHPEDIRVLLERGWGQRHPMAWRGLVKAPVPVTFCMVYAPRDESDLRIVRKIIEAAIWYTTAEKVEIQPEAES